MAIRKTKIDLEHVRDLKAFLDNKIALNLVFSKTIESIIFSKYF